MKDYLIAERPDVLEGRTHKVKTPCGTLYVTLNELNNMLFEVRITKGKPGSCTRAMLETIGILLSVLLQTKMPREKIEKTLSNRITCNCSEVIRYKGEEYASCVDYIVRLMLEDLASRGEIKIEEEVTLQNYK